MSTIAFYDLTHGQDALFKYAIIVSRYQNQWIFCKHRERDTWEIPGGHRESGENIEATARRELYEETGAARFRLSPVCVYGVKEESGGETFGMLYFAEVQEFFALPDFEMERIGFFDAPPEALTYPDIQPALLKKAEETFRPEE